MIRCMATGSTRGRWYRAGRWAVTAVLVTLTALTGCGPDTPPAPSAPTPGTSTAPPSTSPPSPSHPSHSPDGTSTNSEEPAPRDVLVELNVTGGFAGVRNQLIVRYDGSYTTRSGTEPPRTGRMEPAEVAELRAALEDPAFAAVPARPTGEPVHDGFQYVVTYRHRVVVATDGDLTYERAAQLLNESWGSDSGLRGEHLERINAGYENSRNLVHRFEPQVYDGELLIFPATGDDDGTTRARSADEWRPLVTGRIVEHPVDCGHNDMIEPQSLAVIGPVLSRYLEAGRTRRRENRIR